jgi:hypothetical protein
MDQSIRLNTGDIRVCLLRDGYSFSPHHRYFFDVIGYANGVSSSLRNKRFDAGVFDADDTSIYAITALSCTGIAMFENRNSEETSPLILYGDSDRWGLPLAPYAGQIVDIAFDNGPARIFRIKQFTSLQRGAATTRN